MGQILNSIALWCCQSSKGLMVTTDKSVYRHSLAYKTRHFQKNNCELTLSSHMLQRNNVLAYPTPDITYALEEMALWAKLETILGLIRTARQEVSHDWSIPSLTYILSTCKRYRL